MASLCNRILLCLVGDHFQLHGRRSSSHGEREQAPIILQACVGNYYKTHFAVCVLDERRSASTQLCTLASSKICVLFNLQKIELIPWQIDLMRVDLMTS